MIETTAVDGVVAEEGRWIETRMNAKLIRVLRQPTIAIHEQMPIGIDYAYAGEITYKGVLIRATCASDELEDGEGLRVGRRYLAFLDQNPNSTDHFTYTMMFTADQAGVLDSPTRPGSKATLTRPFRILHGHTVDELAAWVGLLPSRVLRR